MNPETDATPTGDDQKLWTGLEDYMDSPEFRAAMADEFPEDAAEWTDPVSRRRFMTLMGASLALAGAAGCSPRPAPMRKIVPYTRQPEQVTPGVPLYFASAFPLNGFVHGVLVASREGRPIKVEGNPDHPSSLGGCDVFAQGSLLDLYDPDRSKTVTHRGNPVTYDEAVLAVRGAIEQQRGKRGAGLRILSETVTSPTLGSEITALLNDLPDARWAIYDVGGLDNVREGARRAFGRPLNVAYDLTKADVVVSLDADFLAVGPGSVRYCRDLASRRKIRQDGKTLAEVHEGKSDKEGVQVDAMSRVYAVECMPTTTGSKADHRLPLRSSDVEVFARKLAAELGVGVPSAGNLPDKAQAWLAPLAADIRKPERKGKVVVVPGDHQPAAVHAVCHAINSALGAIGQTVILSAPADVRPEGKVIDLPTLVKEMADKKVDTLLILGGNPAYAAPADLDFAGAINTVGFRVHLGAQVDETAVLCEWHINEAHYLETWGDGRGHDGTAAIQQPLIAPLNGGKCAIEFVAAIRNEPLRNPGGLQPPAESREIVRAYWRKWFADNKKSGAFETFWQESVRSGVVAQSTPGRETPGMAANWAQQLPSTPPISGEYEINFRLDPTVHDGRFANNGWLQELPKPITMLCWDNAAFVSPETGKKLGLEKDWRWTAGERGRAEVNVIELEYKGRKLKVPAWVLPGHADGAVTVHLGGGRERAGRVSSSPSEPNAEGKPVRGFNANALLTRGDGPSLLYIDGGLKVAKTRDTYFLACVQGNYSMVQRNPITGNPMDRKPARRATVAEYKANPMFARVLPTAAGESMLVEKNVPGPRPHTHDGHDHNGQSHADRHDDHGGHDRRLLELTMYHPNETLYPGLKNQRRWAMAIDLGACTGCNACVMACVSENNTPVVGKYEVTRAHEMHWIRVDRYYEGNPDDGAALQTHFQPVPCQQCEKAPCEVVCPVGATVHSADGLNDMVYNRCVGTRYCSNNCPYKVRRFNFLTFQDWFTDSIKLGRNPDVSVRSRGVMEKCTYCVQRIRYAEIVAEREGRPIRDGEILTACQSACPSNAIVFGDLNDDHAVVGRWKTEPTNYGLLAELNTMPRTTYLASVRNPNPDMPKGA
jgi:molybdopterin-containing oxidoreductase family iron-sulfur binding subunit